MRVSERTREKITRLRMRGREEEMENVRVRVSEKTRGREGQRTK